MRRGLKKELSVLAGVGALGMLLSGRRTGAMALGLAAIGMRLTPPETYTFKNKSVFITGGSRGLGFTLAEALMREGARVTIIARDAAELKRAGEKLEPITTGEILVIRGDVTRPDVIGNALGQAVDRFGGLDVLINNAGTISVGPFEAMDQPDFDAQTNLQIDAVFNAVQEAIPYFRQGGGGRIINISSIGGLLPVPHMAAYCTSKFALTGLSESLAIELVRENIVVTTVCPGLMRTGSPIQAVFKGEHEKEYAWFVIGDVSPVISVPVENAVRKILDAARHGDSRVVFPAVSRFGSLAHAVLPETFIFVMQQINRLLPKGTSHIRKTGAESQGWLESRNWYKSIRPRVEAAEVRGNQTEKFDAEFNLGLATSGADGGRGAD